MVGLSVVLENHGDLARNKITQVISKGGTIKAPLPNPKSEFSDFGCGFLEYCFLCDEKLSPGKDIYMYEGYKAFCSEECRCRQIFMDERSYATSGGCTREYNSSAAAASASSKAR